MAIRCSSDLQIPSPSGSRAAIASAELSLPTIQRMETIGPERSSAGNVEKLQRAIEGAGIEFIEEDGRGVGVRFRSASGG